MSSKTVIVVAVSALACGMLVSSASAKYRHHVRHMAAAPKAEPMKAVPGNNPFSVAGNSESKDRSKYQAPQATPGNNPMVIVKPK
jgi:hypothetical protein